VLVLCRNTAKAEGHKKDAHTDVQRGVQPMPKYAKFELKYRQIAAQSAQKMP
jgi:hypothetical protein